MSEGPRIYSEMSSVGHPRDRVAFAGIGCKSSTDTLI